MLRRLAALAACGFLLAIAATGSAYVTSLPSGADVWLDGTYVGRTPLVLDALSAGRHTVSLTKSGWNARQLDIAVETGQTTLSSTRLERARQTSLRPPPGSIAFHGLVVRGVKVDGVPAKPEADGTYDAASGTHLVTAETPKGPVTRTVTVWPQTRTDVVIIADEPVRPSVVAPAEDYVPKSAIKIEGERIVIRHGGHEVLARLGETSYRVDGHSVEYDAAPTLIGSRVYLPIDLLTTLFGSSDR